MISLQFPERDKALQLLIARRQILDQVQEERGALAKRDAELAQMELDLACEVAVLEARLGDGPSGRGATASEITRQRSPGGSVGSSHNRRASPVPTSNGLRPRGGAEGGMGWREDKVTPVPTSNGFSSMHLPAEASGSSTSTVAPVSSLRSSASRTTTGSKPSVGHPSRASPLPARTGKEPDRQKNAAHPVAKSQRGVEQKRSTSQRRVGEQSTTQARKMSKEGPNKQSGNVVSRPSRSLSPNAFKQSSRQGSKESSGIQRSRQVSKESSGDARGSRQTSKQASKAHTQEQSPKIQQDSYRRSLSPPIIIGDDFDTAEIMAALDETHRPLFKALDHWRGGTYEEEIPWATKPQRSRSLGPWALSSGAVNVSLGKVCFDTNLVQ